MDWPMDWLPNLSPQWAALVGLIALLTINTGVLPARFDGAAGPGRKLAILVTWLLNSVLTVAAGVLLGQGNVEPHLFRVLCGLGLPLGLLTLVIFGRSAPAVGAAPRDLRRRLIESFEEAWDGRLRSRIQGPQPIAVPLRHNDRYLEPPPPKWGIGLRRFGQRVWDRASRRVRPLAGREDLQRALAAAHGRLAIVGALGSGKTTLLLDLGLQLLSSAKDEGRAPLPIWLDWDRWPEANPAIADWVVAQLTAQDRAIDAETVRQWLDGGRLVLLLDGLDDLPAARQVAALRALDRLLQDKAGRVQLVLCGRPATFAAIAAQERALLQWLRGAVELLPLTMKQIGAYLRATGRDFLIEPLQGDRAGLGTLAKLPLMLDLMVFAYPTPTAIAPRLVLSPPDGVTADPRSRLLDDAYQRLQGDRADLPMAERPYHLTWLVENLRKQTQWPDAPAIAIAPETTSGSEAESEAAIEMEPGGPAISPTPDRAAPHSESWPESY